MRAGQVIECLPQLTEALRDIADLKGLSGMGGDSVEEFPDDLTKLGELPGFERTQLGRVIPVNAGLNASPRGIQIRIGDGIYGPAPIMEVHGAIRQGLSHGIDAMGHIAGYSAELSSRQRRSASKAIKGFTGFAAVRATQISFGGSRRGDGTGTYDGEGHYIARHRDSYEVLRPFMIRNFRDLVDRSVAAYS